MNLEVILTIKHALIKLQYLFSNLNPESSKKSAANLQASLTSQG